MTVPHITHQYYWAAAAQLRLIGNVKPQDICNKAIEIALADQQPWIAVQDEKDFGKNKVEGLIYLWRSNHSYRITGVSKGYELK